MSIIAYLFTGVAFVVAWEVGKLLQGGSSTTPAPTAAPAATVSLPSLSGPLAQLVLSKGASQLEQLLHDAFDSAVQAGIGRILGTVPVVAPAIDKAPAVQPAPSK